MLGFRLYQLLDHRLNHVSCTILRAPKNHLGHVEFVTGMNDNKTPISV